MVGKMLQIQTLVENDFLLYKEEVRRVYHERN